MPPVKRAENVLSLINRGYSQRELARGLKVDKGTIRRDLEIAKLSDQHKDRIRAGESVASVLELAVVAPVADSQERQRDVKSFIERVNHDARQAMQDVIRNETMWAKRTRLARKS